MIRMIKNRPDILHPELSYEITGVCYKIHNKLGRFCRERQYGDEFEGLLKSNKIRYIRECNLEDFGKKLSGNTVDFLIEDKILVDFKAKNFITKDDYFQMLRYLQCSGLKLGLIVNFRNTHLKPKRIINLANNS